MKTENHDFYLYENCAGEHGNNELVFGDAGQEKILFMKKELLQFTVDRMNNVKERSQVLVIDSDGEFLSLANASNGHAISISNSRVPLP